MTGSPSRAVPLRRPAVAALLLLGGVAVATPPADATSTPWACLTADDGARTRRQEVERGLLPGVVFEGETQPAGIESRLAHHKTPALSVAVIRDGRLDWSAAWGRLQAGGAPAGCDSLFQAGSLAKPATVLAVLRMRQQGLIDLDRNIDAYLASYRLPAGRQTEANPVTLRHLLAHTAGITPGGYAGYAAGEPLPTDAQTVRGEPPANGRKAEVLQPPGSELAYSGGGYTMVEIALQDHLRQPFEHLMRDWLLAPAGLRQADFTVPLPAASHARAARGHQPDGSGVPGGWRHHPEQAAAGLWATASDLAALLVELRKGHQGQSTVFTQASIRELLATPFEGHAFGFRLIGQGDDVFLTHYGGTVGYRAGATLNLRTGDGAVFLGNSDNAAAVGREFLGAVARTYGWPLFREVRVARAQQPAEALQSLTGRYVFAEQEPTVDVVLEQGGLVVVFPNGDRYAMVAVKGGPRTFIHPETGVRVSFDAEGSATTIQLYGQTGRRLKPDPAAASRSP
jgi:CubicO group peptidase (beta-lactamase class C family)